MKNQKHVGITLAGILILLLFTVSIACAQTPTLGTTTPTPTQTLGPTPVKPVTTLGTTPPTTPSATLGGNGIPLNPVICVVALSCVGLVIALHKRK
jgi:hypothetical protein